MSKTYEMPCGVVCVSDKRVTITLDTGEVIHDKTYRSNREAVAFAKRVTAIV